MTKSTATDKIVLRRTYNALAERVFRAWTDPVELKRWYSPEDGWTVGEVEVDLRVGGRFRITFGPPGEAPYIEAGEYREVVRRKRLVFAVTVSRRGQVIHEESVCTVEFIDLGGRTEVVLTDQGPAAKEHTTGWQTALEHLAHALA